MSTRFRLGIIAIVCGSLVAGVVGGMFRGGGDNGNIAREARGAEEKASAAGPRYRLSEQSPPRPFKQFGLDVSMFAARDIYPAGDTRYYIQVVGWDSLTADDAAALVQLSEQLQNQKKSDAKEVSSAFVFFTYSDYSTGQGKSFTYDLKQRVWLQVARDARSSELFIEL